MKNGRTVHSLVKALSKYKNNKFVMISTPELQMPEYIIDILKKSGCEYSFSSSLEEAISSLDVLYMTRIQQERFKSEEEYERQKGVYVLDEEKMKLAKKDLVVLHPLPRVDEITVGVDDDSRAKYFEQTEYGMYARMALIILMLENRGGKVPEKTYSTHDKQCKNPRCVTNSESYVPHLSTKTEESLSANTATARRKNENTYPLRFAEDKRQHRKAYRCFYEGHKKKR